ncbi:MAG: BMP family ABC transporter substrate-binding protein [Treponema sp.]|nr:BMP family ABC transporter substrate-binding protein [Candidatus Treponema equifaecale]
MKFNKLLVIIFSVFALTGCSKNSGNKITKDNIKVGFIYNGLINDEGYTETHDAGRKALDKLGIPTLYVENVSDQGDDAYVPIMDLIAEGCNVIYATSYGFGPSMLKAADEHPEIIFGHCTGIETRPNLCTYFGKIYQARYLSGIVAGLKTKTNKVGFVAAYEYPECIRGINAFALGVQSVNPEAVVEVEWTHTWYDPRLEKEGTLKLLKRGCDVIEQHQDTPAPQLTAQDYGAFCNGYNFNQSAHPVAPNAYLTAPIFHWDVFIKHDIQRILEGRWEGKAYWEGFETGVVDLAELSPLCVPGTIPKVERAKNRIINGDLYIFTGEIYDNQGNLRVKSGERMSEDEIWVMNWFVKGVNGKL